MLAWPIIEDIFSPWTKVFCLEIYFLLYFSCTFNLLFRNSSFHGFFFFFWKKSLWCERRSDVVWEWLSQFWPSKYSWAGIIISSCTGNHLVFFQKIQKRSSLPFSLDLEYESLWTLGVHSLSADGCRLLRSSIREGGDLAKGCCHHIYLLPRQTRVLKNG